MYIYVFSIACIMVFRAIFVLCDPYGKLYNLHSNYIFDLGFDIQVSLYFYTVLRQRDLHERFYRKYSVFNFFFRYGILSL